MKRGKAWRNYKLQCGIFQKLPKIFWPQGSEKDYLRLTAEMIDLDLFSHLPKVLCEKIYSYYIDLIWPRYFLHFAYARGYSRPRKWFIRRKVKYIILWNGEYYPFKFKSKHQKHYAIWKASRLSKFSTRRLEILVDIPADNETPRIFKIGTKTLHF